MPENPLPIVPLPIVLGFFLLVVGMAGLVCFAAYRAGSPARSARAVITTVLSLLAWLGITGGLTLSGFFADSTARPPHALIGLVPVVVATLVLATVRPFRKALRSLPLAWVIGFQAFRVAVEGALFALAPYGVVPHAMTFEGRNWDILTGLTALPVAYLLARRQLPRQVAIAWNLVGLGLLINVVWIALRAIPGPLHLETGDSPNLLFAIFPFVYLPTFLVPLALLGHLISLQQLLLPDSRRAQAPSVAPPSPVGA